jgi:hypothetical protein
VILAARSLQIGLPMACTLRRRSLYSCDEKKWFGVEWKDPKNGDMCLKWRQKSEYAVEGI